MTDLTLRELKDEGVVSFTDNTYELLTNYTVQADRTLVISDTETLNIANRVLTLLGKFINEGTTKSNDGDILSVCLKEQVSKVKFMNFGNFINNGSITFDTGEGAGGGGYSSFHINYGTFINKNTFVGANSNGFENRGTFTNDIDSSFSINGRLTNSGVFTNNTIYCSGFSIKNSGTITNNGSMTDIGFIENTFGTIYNNGKFSTVAFDDKQGQTSIGNFTNDCNGIIINSGVLDIPYALVLNDNGSLIENTPSGTLTLDKYSKVINSGTSTFINNGITTCKGSFDNQGGVSSNNKFTYKGITDFNNSGSFTNTGILNIAKNFNNNSLLTNSGTIGVTTSIVNNSIIVNTTDGKIFGGNSDAILLNRDSKMMNRGSNNIEPTKNDNALYFDV